MQLETHGSPKPAFLPRQYPITPDCQPEPRRAPLTRLTPARHRASASTLRRPRLARRSSRICRRRIRPTASSPRPWRASRAWWRRGAAALSTSRCSAHRDAKVARRRAGIECAVAVYEVLYDVVPRRADLDPAWYVARAGRDPRSREGAFPCGTKLTRRAAGAPRQRSSAIGRRGLASGRARSGARMSPPGALARGWRTRRGLDGRRGVPGGGDRRLGECRTATAAVAADRAGVLGQHRSRSR